MSGPKRLAGVCTMASFILVQRLQVLVRSNGKVGVSMRSSKAFHRSVAGVKATSRCLEVLEGAIAIFSLF